MSLFEQNLSALRSVDPRLADAVLAASVPEEYVVSTDRQGQPGLRVGRVTLHSRYNAAAEATALVDALAPPPTGAGTTGPERVVVLGLGFGHHAERIADRFTGARVVIVEPRIEMLRCAMEQVDLRELMDVAELVVDEDPSRAAAHGALRSGTSPAGGAGTDPVAGRPELEDELIFEHPPSIRLAPEFYEQFRLHRERGKGNGVGKLKILVVGPLYGGSLPIARYCVDALTELGHEVIYADHSLFHEPLEAIDGMTTNEEHRGKLRIMYSTFLGDGVLARCIEEKPDLIFALAQAPLMPETLDKIRKLDIPTAFWFVEDYHQMTYWQGVAPLYDFFFTIQKDRFLEALKEAGVPHGHYLPLAADPAVHRPLDLTPEERAELGSEVSFVGAGYYNRTQFFLGLLDLDFKIWGSGWNVHTGLGGRVQREGARVPTEECVKIFNACPVNVNLHSSTYHAGVAPHGDFVNPRAFELAACGAFQLVDERSELPALFEPGREVVTYRDLDDLKGKIRHYLDRPDERRAVAEAARARVLRDHTYRARMASMVDTVFAEDARLARRAEQHDRVADLLHASEGDPELHTLLHRFEGRDRLTLTDAVEEIREGDGDLTEAEGIFLLMGEVWTWAKEKQIVR